MLEKIHDNLFSALDQTGQGRVGIEQIFALLEKNGIQPNDPRLKQLRTFVQTQGQKIDLDAQEFSNLIEDRHNILEKSIQQELIVPDFQKFSHQIQELAEATQAIKSGDVAKYIPQLARIEPDQFAISICTIDGQQYHFGDYDTDFCLQSSCKPINYCIALELNGAEKVHQHMGREPSGRQFNAISLNQKGLPHNPLINSGAMMCCALIKPELGLSERFDYVMQYWEKISGGSKPRFDNAVYHSEKETAHRNYALAHLMQEVRAFPAQTSLAQTLDFYIQCCSITMNTSHLAKAAATFANAGICPFTNDRIFSDIAIKNSLTMMSFCGMYDFSGEFAFHIGIPAKSGVSGAMMLVIPNLMGIAIWSPRLDKHGNSVRGIDFSQRLVKTFNLHNYDNMSINCEKIDPRLKRSESEVKKTLQLIWAASHGDVPTIQSLIATGVNINESNYDARTAMHLAAANGHLDTVRFLRAHGAKIDLMDRWGNTALDAARNNNHPKVLDYLETKSRGA